MTSPVWLDEQGRRRPIRRRWSCGAEDPIIRFQLADLRHVVWPPMKTTQIVNWCGRSQEYVTWSVPTGEPFHHRPATGMSSPRPWRRNLSMARMAMMAALLLLAGGCAHGRRAGSHHQSSPTAHEQHGGGAGGGGGKGGY